ncbi:B3 domain-containing transcription repressor VAL2-like [Pyrus ussuriensis x Pyrus communis]|uniref:B3 domain-containing transcription repressor VAL2-like n=1 Tax=Pyrus ussuriensis x Pyrus communis TaxID=2448454 RepID=A0A5N5H585_9ROSA|nr:B3 domain-containing transcription repressor VAL2-like [Pyrus ussuriensis x Pyrus communis]
MHTSPLLPNQQPPIQLSARRYPISTPSPQPLCRFLPDKIADPTPIPPPPKNQSGSGLAAAAAFHSYLLKWSSSDSVQLKVASLRLISSLCGSLFVEFECGNGAADLHERSLRDLDVDRVEERSVYEQSIYCDVYHSEESGWRECGVCGKISSDEKPDGLGTSKISEPQSNITDNQLDGRDVEKLKLVQLGNNKDSNGLMNLLQLRNDNTNGLMLKLKHDDVPPPGGEIGGACFSNFNQAPHGSSEASKAEVFKANLGINNLYESLPHTNLSMTLGSPLGKANPFPGAIVDEREHSKTPSPLPLGARPQHLFPKPPKLALSTGLEEKSTMVSHVRVARPPAEGRGRNQLLPRYWPRITDQELQQISGDSNSTIVPLFEKMLSASDAGRIGRLVLPKACAEAYFPPISQPEGLPLRIQDVKGKEWMFQFRFWPNNNSRMYVLEGVTPCIQSMQLQAGDTVTFSRMDPEGKLIMGFRKASNTVAMQDSHLTAIQNGPHSSETLFSGVFENLPVISGYPGLLQSFKGSMDPHLNALSKHLTTSSGDISWNKTEKQEGRTREGLQLPSLVPERKRTRNIGSKSKRLLIDSQDALELKLTWEEAQDLLRPPPASKPSTVVIEDLEFEEYEEPPVFGKRSIFTVRSTGEQEQWVQCDSCSKWRRLPADALLSSKWICADNAWDRSRSSCSMPDELSPRELENFLRMSKELKKRRIAADPRPTPEHEASGLDALANAAILGDSVADPEAALVATTTKHPRHRPGCSCIVCIQPPSGKGKHKPTCTCNVCMTVKRRFKTMMINKKKRQSEREAEIACRSQHTWAPRDEAEVDSTSRFVSSHVDPSDNEARSANESESKSQSKLAETGKGILDLNSHPGREGDLQAGPDHVSMMSLVQVATLPLETYLKHNGITSLISEQQESSTSHVPPQVANETDEQLDENHCLERESGVEERPDQSQDDPLR